MTVGVFVHVGENETMGRGHERTASAITFDGFGAGAKAEVGVAGAIDVDLGAESGEAGFVGNDEGVHFLAVGAHLDGGERGVKENRGAVLEDEVVVDLFERLGVDGNPVELILEDVGRGFFGGVQHLFGESAIDDLLAVGERAPSGNEGAGAHAAEITHAFDEEGAGALAGGGGGGGAARGTAADDDHIPRIIEGQGARGKIEGIHG